jgi:hypothetical protein
MQISHGTSFLHASAMLYSLLRSSRRSRHIQVSRHAVVARLPRIRFSKQPKEKGKTPDSSLLPVRAWAWSTRPRVGAPKTHPNRPFPLTRCIGRLKTLPLFPTAFFSI